MTPLAPASAPQLIPLAELRARLLGGEHLSKRLIKDSVAAAYLDAIDPLRTGPTAPDARTIVSSIISEEATWLAFANNVSSPPRRMTTPRALSPSQIAMILIRLHRATLLVPGGKLLVWTGQAQDRHLVEVQTMRDLDDPTSTTCMIDSSALFCTERSALRALARRYHQGLRGVDAGRVETLLRAWAPQQRVSEERHGPRRIRTHQPHPVEIEGGPAI